MKDLKGPDQRKTTVAVASQKNNAKQITRPRRRKCVSREVGEGVIQILLSKTHQEMMAKNITYAVQEMTRSTRYAGKSC